MKESGTCNVRLIITASVCLCVHRHLHTLNFVYLFFFLSFHFLSSSFPHSVELGDLDTAENGVGGGSGGRRQSVLLEEIDFQLSNDYLLGAVAPHWHHCPLLFTFKNGFLALQSSQPESM